LINGASRSNVDELLTVTKQYAVELKMPKIDLRELALLRFIQGKSERFLAQHFKRSKTTIHELIFRMIKNGFRYVDLTKQQKEELLEKLK
jgi:transposase